MTISRVFKAMPFDDKYYESVKLASKAGDFSRLTSRMTLQDERVLRNKLWDLSAETTGNESNFDFWNQSISSFLEYLAASDRRDFLTDDEQTLFDITEDMLSTMYQVVEVLDVVVRDREK